MKKLFLLLILISSPIFAVQVQLQANRDAQGVVVSYQVWTWNGPDHGLIVTKYTIAEVQGKFPSVFDKNESGASKNPDRIFINYNSDATISDVNFQVTSTKAAGGEFESKSKSQPELSAKLNTEVLTIKADVETKTGSDIGGGPIK